MEKTENFDNVELNIKDNIAIFTIKNPPVNTLSIKTMNDLHGRLSQVEKNKEVKVVLLKGEGNHFVAGAELNEFIKINQKEEASSISYMGHQLMDRIEFFHIPVIAVIDGACLGGGLELALACDIRMSSVDAIFGLPEVTLGIIPGAGGTQRLPKVIGASRAKSMILSGDQINAQKAFEIGLINEVYPKENLEKESIFLAEQIAGNGKGAIESALLSITEGLNGSERAGYRMEAEKFGDCFTTYNKEEGMEAFLNKRKPIFKND